MKFKKILLTLLIMPISLVPVISVVSCFNKKAFRSFDIGYAINDISSLNYIKYESVVPFTHSVVETFIKNAPTYESSLDSYLNKISRIMFKQSSLVSRNSQSLKDYSYTSGTLKNEKIENIKTKFPALQGYDKNSNLFTVRLNGISKWSNGDNLTPSNFIDAFVYVIDLNTGSQLIENFLKLDINNSREFVSAQISYSKKFKKLYKNPFGYIKNKNYDASNKHSIYWVQRNDDFPLQIYNKTLKEINNMSFKAKTNYLKNQIIEKLLVKNIEKYGKNLGIYADLNSSHPFTNVEEWNLKKIASNAIFNDDNFYKNPNTKNGKIYPFIFQIKTSFVTSTFQFLLNKLIKSKWLPINKKFVESIGGIEKFGLNSSNFLFQGPFNIDNMILGIGGSIILSKNKKYWDSKNTIPNRIKLFFQSDPMVLFSLFEDGFISDTKINSISTLKLYSDKNYRDFINKTSGRGSTALVFNLDENSPGFNPILKDENLRKAIFYSINRKEIIKLSSFDSTIPIYSYIDANADTKSLWRARELYGINMLQKIGHSIYYDKYEPSVAKKMYPYKISSYASVDSLYGNFHKNDLFNNEKLAKKYFNAFLKSHPGKHTITYNYDSTKSNLQIGIALQSGIKKIFGDKLKIEIKGYSKSVYETFYFTGEFQLTYRNLDYLTNNNDGTGGTSAFLLSDGILKKEQKALGFLKNPTGNWKFSNVLKNYSKSLNLEQSKMKLRLNISNIIWDKIYELSTIPEFLKNIPQEKQILFLKRRLNAFLLYTDFEYEGRKFMKDSNFLTNEKIMTLVKVANKLILEASPIIPLFLVDVSIKVSRIVSFRYGYDKFNYDYGYDYKYKPINNLPGKESLLG